MNQTHRVVSIYQPSIASDIIALLVSGVIFVGLFLCWQYYLEKRFDDHNSTYSVFTPPPLMRISIWTRAHGRLGAVMLVAFTTWCCFQSWLYWIQVYSTVHDRIIIIDLVLSQMYYQNYHQYSAVQTAVRLVPQFFSGIVCNVFFAMMAARVPLVWLVGPYIDTLFLRFKILT